ncbi:Gfo/Idh/MocA family protein [Ramlibacter montanisoli]|uniref:Gfo/Idh/MocA family oxidoreductase n=1 Tax=Ramlibacter montanisoli TaxID=2732512 RepID=A0A849K108_9BURK|nr:Gfo/Idh/MocA family oxidoreductase [Ramlibacter montanisoli]NNU42202.1 Gfo/Idh/MocA family oxidoreductase [Ramlibacter montanisoli]
MKALVIGLGSMGRRRVRCLQQHGVDAVAGFDTRADRRERAAKEYGISVRDQLAADDLRGFDVVVISTPPDQHHTAIEWSIAAGKPCFVEASVIRAPLPALDERARAKGVLVAPSCTLRFHSAIRDITQAVQSGRYGKPCNFSYHCGQYLPDWHPWEKVTDYYVSNPLTGGAREIVPFELTWMVDAFGWPQQVQGMKLRTADVGAPIDDTYAALLRFDGFVGSLVVDVVARQAVRKLTLNFERASLSWDWDSGTVRIYEADAARSVELHQPRSSAHAGYHQNIGEAMYVAEIGSFLAAAQGKASFPHSLQDDIRVLSLLEAMEAA